MQGACNERTLIRGFIKRFWTPLTIDISREVPRYYLPGEITDTTASLGDGTSWGSTTEKERTSGRLLHRISQEKSKKNRGNTDLFTLKTEPYSLPKQQ